MADAGCGTFDDACCTDLAKEQGPQPTKSEHASQTMGAHQAVFCRFYLTPNLSLELGRGSWMVKSMRMYGRFFKQAKMPFTYCLNTLTHLSYISITPQLADSKHDRMAFKDFTGGNTSTVTSTKFNVCVVFLIFIFKSRKEGESSFSFVPDLLNDLCWKGPRRSSTSNI